MKQTRLKPKKERVEPRMVLQVPQRETKGWPAARQLCIERAGGKCARCGEALGKRPEVNHKLAVAEGGTNAQSNLEALCTACHKPHTAALAGRLAKAKRVASKHAFGYVPPRFRA